MLSSVEQAFVGRDEKRAPLKTPAWEARFERGRMQLVYEVILLNKILRNHLLSENLQ